MFFCFSSVNLISPANFMGKFANYFLISKNWGKNPDIAHFVKAINSINVKRLQVNSLLHCSEILQVIIMSKLKTFSRSLNYIQKSKRTMLEVQNLTKFVVTRLPSKCHHTKHVTKLSNGVWQMNLLPSPWAPQSSQAPDYSSLLETFEEVDKTFSICF
jgi:hypothetical protein